MTEFLSGTQLSSAGPALFFGPERTTTIAPVRLDHAASRDSRFAPTMKSDRTRLRAHPNDQEAFVPKLFSMLDAISRTLL